MTEPIQKKPAWTVFYNTHGDGSWVGTAWEFFDDADRARTRYDELFVGNLFPTLRRYHDATDRWHLGAVHR